MPRNVSAILGVGILAVTANLAAASEPSVPPGALDGPLQPYPVSSVTHVGPNVELQWGSLVGDGRSIWVGDGQGVSRIDASNGAVVLRATVGANANVAVDGETVWISSYTRDVVAPIDPDTGIVDGSRQVAIRAPSQMLVAGGSLWVTSPVEQEIRRFDAVTGEPQTTIPVPDAGVMADGFGSVWVASAASGGLARIDPDTNEVTEIPLGILGSHVPLPVTVAEGFVWVGSSNARLYRVDPETLEVATGVGRVRTGIDEPMLGIAVTDDSVWLTGASAYPSPFGNLVQLDPVTLERTGTWKLDGGAGNGAAVVDGRLWTAVGFSDLVALPLPGQSPSGEALPAVEGPPGWRFERDVSYATASDGTGVPMDVLAPADASGAPVVVLVPGGPYEFGNRWYMSSVASALVDRGAVVLEIDYRSPATGDTDAASGEDLACARAWAQEHAAEYGADPARLVAAGHSHGGWLLLSALFMEPAAVTCNGGRADPAAIVSLGSVGSAVPMPQHATSAVPVRLLLGTLDDAYPSAQGFANEMTAAGYDVSLEIVEGATHGQVVDRYSLEPR
jgi:acetyl esterase/lipase